MSIVLGCWYTNNCCHEKILQSSLNSIRRAVDASETPVHVRACTWKKIDTEPFPQYISWFHMGNHLCIALQIKRILNEVAREPLHYDIVCFLEHDVLYPEDYFDRVARALDAHPTAKGVFNNSYIGMNETGWLAVNSRHCPMHQMSLRADTARSHIDEVITKCINNGATGMEPGHDYMLKMYDVEAAPAAHINHSQNFTNHFDIYDKDSLGLTVHPCWGDFRQYYPEGEQAMNTRPAQIEP